MSVIIAFFPIGGAIALLGATNPVAWAVIGVGVTVYAAKEINKAVEKEKNSKK